MNINEYNSKKDNNMKKYMLIVMSNPIQGKDEDYKKWYIEQHIPDCLKIKGFVNGKLLASTEPQHPIQKQIQYKYVAVFNIETNAIDVLINELKNRMNTPFMLFSDTFDFQNFHIQFFEYLGDNFI